MNFKQFSTSDNQWHDIPYYHHKTATDTLTLPAVIYPNDTSITVGIKGNEEHTGTPSPQNPVVINGTGDMSSNILTAYKENYSINASGVETYNNVAMIYKASVSVASSTFVLSFGGLSEGDAVRIHAYTGDTWKEQIAAIAISQVPVSFTVSSDVDNIRVSIRKTATDVTLTDGQFKIPISSANTTTPVYLGEVETTRKIKKLVLTGEESEIGVGVVSGVSRARIRIRSNYGLGSTRDDTVFSHYVNRRTTSDGNATCETSGENIIAFLICDNVHATSETAFREYLAQQYAAGTPMTIWYVLATPKTEVVNEPLMKIGSYSDSLTTSIPVTAGENTLDVQTTVQPSEVTAGFSGWHPVQSVHERENGQWD